MTPTENFTQKLSRELAGDDELSSSEAAALVSNLAHRSDAVRWAAESYLDRGEWPASPDVAGVTPRSLSNRYGPGGVLRALAGLVDEEAIGERRGLAGDLGPDAAFQNAPIRRRKTASAKSLAPVELSLARAPVRDEVESYDPELSYAGRVSHASEAERIEAHEARGRLLLSMLRSQHAAASYERLVVIAMAVAVAVLLVFINVSQPVRAIAIGADVAVAMAGSLVFRDRS